MKIRVNRNGWIVDVKPGDLTTKELVHELKSIVVDGGGWMPETTEKEGYAAINEAVRRLKEYEKEGKCK